MVVEFECEELVKATENFSPSRLIGKGSHGSVYKGVIDSDQRNLTVAVKKSTMGTFDYSSNDNSKKLENEILVLSSISECPYTIGFMGKSSDSSDLGKRIKLLVMEFMPNGSLYDLLHVAKTPPSWPQRVEVAIRIARALQSLHEGKPLIIHRDVKSANVLFDSNWNAKLADFGLAVLQVDSLGHQLSQPAGTIGYLDPCYTIPSKLSTRNDIFSYGVVLLEIISGRKVIDMSSAPASIVEWGVPLIGKQKLMEICDKRIGMPHVSMEGTIRHMLNVAAHCVSSNEENRPSISKVLMGMEGSLTRRVKSPSWGMLMKNTVVMLRKRRRLGKQWPQPKLVAQKHDVIYSDFSKGKLLLREILADVTLN